MNVQISLLNKIDEYSAKVYNSINVSYEAESQTCPNNWHGLTLYTLIFYFRKFIFKLNSTHNHTVYTMSVKYKLKYKFCNWVPRVHKKFVWEILGD